MNRHKKTGGKASRLLSLLLVFAMLTSLLTIPAAAAPASTTSNASFNTLVAGMSGSEGQLDLSGHEDLVGVLDLQEVKEAFPNLAYLDVSSTNITKLTNLSSLSNAIVLYDDTFYSDDNPRTIAVDTEALAAVDLSLSKAADEKLNVKAVYKCLKVKTASGQLEEIPEGLITKVTYAYETNGTWAFGGSVQWAGSSPNWLTPDTLPEDVPVASMEVKNDHNLAFALYYAGTSGSARADQGIFQGITFAVTDVSVNLTADKTAFYQGETGTFTLTKTDDQGNPADLGALTYALKDSSGNGANSSFGTITESKNGNTATYTVPMIQNNGAMTPAKTYTLTVTETDDGTTRSASVTFTVAALDAVTSLGLREYNEGSSFTADADVDSTVYVVGGTSVSSTDPDKVNVVGEDYYTTSDPLPTEGDELTLTVSWKLTVTYDANGGTGSMSGSGSPYSKGSTVTVLANGFTAPSGKTFNGWLRQGTTSTTYQAGDTFIISDDVTLVAQWKNTDSGSSGGGGGGGGGSATTTYTLTYESNGGTEYDSEKYTKGSNVTLDKRPSRSGYIFAGWYSDEELSDRVTRVSMNGNKTVYAGWEKEELHIPASLNGSDHFAYVSGYPDGTVQPQKNITRAEVAMIFYRLLNDDVRTANETDSCTFADVTADKWYNTAISTIARAGIVVGRSAQEFDPEAAITRAEFATICAQFDQSGKQSSVSFSDIDGSWAKSYIERAAALGWVSGYEDGTFRPNNSITRAEAMCMINRVLGRLPETEDDLLDGMKTWPDNSDTGAWYYFQVQEATNGHTFDRKSDGVHESWTDLLSR